MKMNLARNAITAAVFAATLIIPAAIAAPGKSELVINHTPVQWSVKGQPITLKARVSGGVGGIDNVTLYYALFRDAAPFRVNMTPSGTGLYVGTIEAGLLSGVNNLSYYIEAQDKEGTLEETPWYDVSFKNPDPSRPAGATGVMVNPTGGARSGTAADDEENSALTIGLIAGGAAAVAIGAYVIADGGSSGGSSDDGGGPDDPGNAAGTYSGTATTCITVPPDPASCSSSAISILIDVNGKVFSDSLVPGKQLVGDLVNNSFSLQADTSNPDTGFTGTIIFSGTVVGDSSIVGTVNGNITDNGVPGFYSGNFNAAK